MEEVMRARETGESGAANSFHKVNHGLEWCFDKMVWAPEEKRHILYVDKWADKIGGGQR